MNPQNLHDGYAVAVDFQGAYSWFLSQQNDGGPGSIAAVNAVASAAINTAATPVSGPAAVLASPLNEDSGDRILSRRSGNIILDYDFAGVEKRTSIHQAVDLLAAFRRLPTRNRVRAAHGEWTAWAGSRAA